MRQTNRDRQREEEKPVGNKIELGERDSNREKKVRYVRAKDV